MSGERVKRSIDGGKFDIKAELSAEIALGMGKKVSSMVCSIILIELYRIFFGSSDNCFSSLSSSLLLLPGTFVCSLCLLLEKELLVSNYFEKERDLFPH